jgi:hypothetical protein
MTPQEAGENTLGPTPAQVRDKALADLNTANRTRAQAHASLIMAELAEAIDLRRRVEANAAAELAAAVAALDGPQERVAEARAELAACEIKISHHADLLDHHDLDTRVDARVYHAQYADELPRLRARLDFAESELLPLFDRRNRAKGQLEAEQSFIRLLQEAMRSPFASAVGQATAAYIGGRGRAVLVEILLSGDRSHPEWAAAETMLGLVMLASGLRSEDYQLPDRDFIPLIMADAAATTPPPSPSAADVMRMSRQEAEDATGQEITDWWPARQDL